MSRLLITLHLRKGQNNEVSKYDSCLMTLYRNDFRTLTTLSCMICAKSITDEEDLFAAKSYV